MSENFTKEWERRKWYLLRSLFSDVPLLSPIPETQELSLEPSPTAATISRPYSPLPDLIIEKEPNRHDEPEEYYDYLERKMIKFYRKLFRNIEKNSLTSGLEYADLPSIDHESFSETAIFVERNVSPELSRNNESPSSNDKSIDQDFCNTKINDDSSILSCEQTFTEIEEELDEERSSDIYNKTNKSSLPLTDVSTSSESQNNGIIITQAMIHHTGNEEVNNHTHDNMSNGVMQTSSSDTNNHGTVNNTTIPLSRTYVRDGEESESDERLESEFEDSSITNNGREVPSFSNDEEPLLRTVLTDASSSPEQLEVMRRRETSNDSGESINALNVGRYLSEDFIEKRLETTYVREMEEAEVSSSEISINLGTTSTSKIKRNEQECTHQDGYRKRRILSEISSHQNSISPKQKKFENLAIQTNLTSSGIERNWLEIQKHFFEGNPRIFKLCSCINHVCC